MPQNASARRRARQRRIVIAVVALLLLLFFSRSICGFVIDYCWWRELGQVPTWLRMSLYRYVPGLAAWLIVFAVLWIAHARGMRHAGARLRDHPPLRAGSPRSRSLLLALDRRAGGGRRLDRGALFRRHGSRPRLNGTIRCSASRSAFISSICRSTAC